MKPKHIKLPENLVTSQEATRLGFLEQALKKTSEADTYLVEAGRFRVRLQAAGSPQEAARLPDIRNELIAAAGFSEKAISHFSSSDLGRSLRTVLERIHSDTGEHWRDAVLYRFLLTRGDSLGGTMRNITGSTATYKFAQAVMASLKSMEVSPVITLSPRNKEKIQRIAWENRIILFDKKPPFMSNNIDVLLLSASSINFRNDSQTLKSKENYIACGEIKGGIDPAGADEHWKTACTALDRIRGEFSPKVPKLFFVGAAIQSTMAEEMFGQLQSGDLAFAANSNVQEQLSDISEWLVSL